MPAISPDGLCNICDEKALVKMKKHLKLSSQQKELLKTAQEYCDEHDKSTEFMLQYMQDVANCTLDQVLEFLTNKNK